MEKDKSITTNKFNKKTNMTLFFISIAATAVIFLSLILIQNKIVNPAGRTDVYIAKNSITENTIIDSSNMNYFFEKKEVSKDSLIDSAAVTTTDIINKYAKEKIFKGEQVSKLALGDEAKRTKSIKNLVETSLKADDISQVVGGTLREGDFVDIILTQSSSQSDDHKTISDMKLKNILISKAFTSDGKEITRVNGSNYAATALNLYVSAQDAIKLDNMISQGKVKVVKAVNYTGNTNEINN